LVDEVFGEPDKKKRKPSVSAGCIDGESVDRM
jgi:hypothetical protein